MSGTVENDLEQFYRLLSMLDALPNQGLPLRDLPGSRQITDQGVYFFRELGEMWLESLPRVVRVGTHGVSAGAKANLRSRLKRHLGNRSGGGNHRGSIFRRHVGEALLVKENHTIPTWGKGYGAPPELKASPSALAAEAAWERKVSEHIGAMTVLWVHVPDEPSATNMRAFIERNAIALLSNKRFPSAPCSDSWLGRYSPTEEIRESQLWNINHVNEHYDRSFLSAFEKAVALTCSAIR